MPRKETYRLGTVFYASVVISLAFVAWGVFGRDSLTRFNSAALAGVTRNFGWLYMLSTSGFVGLLLYLAFSRFGRIRLGGDDERPEFRTSAWVAMLFSAGMGIGLVFYGVAEPQSHLRAPPLGLAAPGSVRAAELGMQYTFLHWGLHPWAQFALVGLALAYFGFRQGKRGLLSSVFHPLLGERVEGPLGQAIDVLSVFVSIVGVAASLGLGALQINSGAAYLFGAPEGLVPQVAIIAVVTVLFTLSAVTGVKRGILFLSNLNMVLFGVVMLFVLLMGPTVYILDTFTATLGNYLADLVSMSFHTASFAQDASWLSKWTLFYWAWWMTWVTWVGTFVARISRGRTIREFVLAVMVVPSLLSFLWFSVMGGAALHLELMDGASLGATGQQNISTALFVMLDRFPLGFLTSVVAVFLIATFFITSADSATYVLGTLTTGGDLNPRVSIKVLLGLFIAGFAVVLLLAGGLTAVQEVAIVAGTPFMLLMIAMAASLLKALVSDPAAQADPAPTLPAPVSAASDSDLAAQVEAAGS